MEDSTYVNPNRVRALLACAQPGKLVGSHPLMDDAEVADAKNAALLCLRDDLKSRVFLFNA